MKRLIKVQSLLAWTLLASLLFLPACAESELKGAPGAEGGPCLEGDRCRLPELACQEGACVVARALCENGQCAPIHPRCWTPCSGDLTADDGTVRVCSAEGLMEGCLGDAVCDRGSCVTFAAGQVEGALSADCEGGFCSLQVALTEAECEEDPRCCLSETGCPEHQRCIRGGCYSNCERDSDCPEGQDCIRHACREACSRTEPCPEEEEVCGDDGYCLVLVDTEVPPVARPEGDFEVRVTRIAFTRNVQEREFTIVNTGAGEQTFVIRKISQTTVSDGIEDVRLAENGETPLLWLRMGVGGANPVQEFPVTIPGGRSATIQLSHARNETLPRWTGAIEVNHKLWGVHRIALSYGEGLKGSWRGKVHYFGVFPDGRDPVSGVTPLNAWRENRTNVALLDPVPNAFLKAWARFRNGGFSLTHLGAIVDATLTGSWKYDRVEELCREAGFGVNAACAPTAGAGSESVIAYTSDRYVDRIPTGVVELNLSLNLRQALEHEAADPDLCDDAEHCYVGRIVSGDSMQYAGDPAIALTLPSDPFSCDEALSGRAGCAVGIASLISRIEVGGRYIPGKDEPGCQAGEGLSRQEVPWLPPGIEAPGGREERAECRDTVVPFSQGSSPAAANMAFAGANPVPDGRTRLRRLELIDGLVVEQNVMLLILRETLDGFHGGTELSAYAYVVLEHDQVEPEAEEYEGNLPTDTRDRPEGLLDLQCAPRLVHEVTKRVDVDSIEHLEDRQLDDLARAVVRGDTSAAGEDPEPIDPEVEQVNYVCLWTEDRVEQSSTGVDRQVKVQRSVFNGDDGRGGQVTCPPVSTVFYFTLLHEEHGGDADVSDHACNRDSPESCLDALDGWVGGGEVTVRLPSHARAHFPAADQRSRASFDLVYRCADELAASCDDDRFDLRKGKVFYEPYPESFWNRIETDIAQAFRYRTQFSTDQGKHVGFAPEVCRGGGDTIPYCYSPDAIEEVAERVDCAVAIYDHFLDNPMAQDDPGFGRREDTITTLQGYLRKNFSVLERQNPYGDPIVEHGFERMYSELLLMLGDDAYTEAFASRFDLASSNMISFDGSAFEPYGPDLSGAAGYELYKLYQATQYYELALDRFYTVTPSWWRAFAAGESAQYVTQSTVTSYLDRVIRASTQLSAAFAEIARRYEALNRPELARRVLERAYARSYLESLILTEVMTGIGRIVSPAEIDQVLVEIEKAQRRYRVAMLDMRSRYDQIQGGAGFLGFPPDYIPFPALDEDDVNAVEVMIERALEALDVAQSHEEAAIEKRRDFEIEAAEFQAELVGIKHEYEEQLGEICGTFVGTDGRVYPAIPRYAHLNPEVAHLDDPCGAVGGGEIWLKHSDLEVAHLNVQRVRQEMKNVKEQARIETERVATQCKLIYEDVEVFLEKQNAVDGLQRTIDGLDVAISQLDKILEFFTELTARVADQSEADKPWEAVMKASSTAVWMTASIAHFAATMSMEIVIATKEAEIRELEKSYEAYTIGRECDYLSADLVYTLREIHLDMKLLELDALNAIWDTQVVMSEIQQLDNNRKRLEGQWREAEQLVIDVAAAANDPNIRIYKNDAIINADRSFERALREVYRATKVFEYYTSQSYADAEKLFLVRMVGAGDVNLQQYLLELQEAFYVFEEQFGNPDARVQVISVRDDVFKIPRYSNDGSPRVLAHEERVAKFRRQLTDPKLLDEHGWVVVNFNTNFGMLSPLTVAHKVLFIEAEIFGDAGDSVGRVYVRQAGTGSVDGTDGRRRFYAFPPRTAVLNLAFNGDERTFGPAGGEVTGPTSSIYRSYRFRDRPFVNSNWQIVLNQRTESVNEDINLTGLDDIVLYVYYTDFTKL